MSILCSQQKTKLDTDTQSENYPETKTIAENGCILETRDKDIILEGVGSVGTYNQWVALSISGEYPKPRYQVKLLCFTFSVRLAIFLHKHLIRHFSIILAWSCCIAR